MRAWPSRPRPISSDPIRLDVKVRLREKKSKGEGEEGGGKGVGEGEASPEQVPRAAAKLEDAEREAIEWPLGVAISLDLSLEGEVYRRRGARRGAAAGVGTRRVGRCRRREPHQRVAALAGEREAEDDEARVVRRRRAARRGAGDRMEIPLRVRGELVVRLWGE